MFGKARPQERIVGRVFQQPPHQVRHAGNQLAVGHVNPQAVAQVDQRLLLGVAHAVEHLQLEAARRQAEVPGHGDAVGQRADVVAAQRRPQRARGCASANRVSRSKLASVSHFCWNTGTGQPMRLGDAPSRNPSRPL